MTVTATPIFPQALKNGFQTIQAADTTTIKTLYTAGANGSRIMGVFVTETSGSNQNMVFYITNSSTNYLISSLPVTANAGNSNTVPAFSLFQAGNGNGAITFLPKDSNGNSYLDLASGSSISAKVLTTTSGVISLITIAEDF